MGNVNHDYYKKFQPNLFFYEYYKYMDKITGFYLKWKKDKKRKHRDILFQEIWKIYHQKLQVYLSQFTGKNCDTTDRASEVLLKVFESIGRYNNDYSFSTWIYTIARNYQIDLLRKKNIQSENIDNHILINEETPESIILRDSEQLIIRKAVSTLESIDRELIYLYYYEELKYKEISEITGIPVGTIKYRMFENKKQLKIELQRSLVI